MSLLSLGHERLVFERRIEVLARRLAAILPQQSSVLDIGCGDGRLANRLLNYRSDLQLRGVDVLVRSGSAVQVEWFDGRSLPCADKSVDVSLLVDVLHHTDDPRILLLEAMRVARKAVVIKDHTREGLLAGATLRLMDWVGNARHGVRLPYNYWTKEQWFKTFRTLGLHVEQWDNRIGLYPWPTSILFERSLHMIVLLTPGYAAC
jgi:SAM-dependent methyltransferase